METYSTEVFRTFKRFVGELTAIAAGVHVGTKFTAETVDSMAETDGWETIAMRFGIVVSGLTSNRVLASAAHLNIVSLYAGFDLFVVNLRSQHFALHATEWRKHEGDGPFDEIRRNCPISDTKLHEWLETSRIAAIDYYRHVRNAVAHPSMENVSKMEQYYEENSAELAKVREAYGMRSAPNRHSSINFHDVKLFAQASIDLCQAIDMAFDPGDARLATQLPPEIRKRQVSEIRRKNAALGWLKTRFGVSGARAERVFALYMAHKLNG